MLNGNKIVPVVVIKELDDTIPTLDALRKGGINVAEITFRTECAKDAISLGRDKFPNMLIGAGTILNVKQAKEAVDAGAEFIVSPGFDDATNEYLKGLEDKTEEFYNNYIDMRQVTDFETSENGLYLYLEDGSGYYWER